MRELSELVVSAQSGDTQAYDTLLQRFQQMAYATAYRYLRDHHRAQDLVQEASIEALMYLSQLKEPLAFPGWFRQIVFRQCTRVLRQTTPPYLSLEAVGEGLFAESDPEALAVQTEMKERVHAAVAALPEQERLVTVLFYGRNYSYNEVSVLLKIPLTTVKKRLYSARQHLKTQLQASLGDAIEQTKDAINGAPDGAICDAIERAKDAPDVAVLVARWFHHLIFSVKVLFNTIDHYTFFPSLS